MRSPFLNAYLPLHTVVSSTDSTTRIVAGGFRRRDSRKQADYVLVSAFSSQVTYSIVRTRSVLQLGNVVEPDRFVPEYLIDFLAYLSHGLGILA